MKKGLILVLGFSFLLLSGCASKSNNPPEKNLAANERATNGQLTDTPENQSRLVAKDYFTLEAPANWLEGSSLPGVSLMMVNSTEEIINPDAKKINFHSYFSVSYDKLGDQDGEQYLAGMKNELTQSVPGIIFTKESSLVIGGQDAKALEANLTQQGVDFKVLMVMIEGGEQDVWIVSFNTLQDSWNDYQSLFYQIAASFRIK